MYLPIHVPNKTLPVNVATYPFRPMDPSWGTLWAIEEKSGGNSEGPSIHCLAVYKVGPQNQLGPFRGPLFTPRIYRGENFTSFFGGHFFFRADDNSVDNDIFWADLAGNSLSSFY